MYFKHPLILLALIFLVIPIIVHLFKLQKFVKTPFTNVKFLKNIILKNRKSSKLKKYLVLISRMLTFTFLILTFAQPYLSKKNTDQKSSLIIYLDNSYSLQTKEKNITTFQFAIQNLLKFNPATNITLITNDHKYPNLTLEQFRTQLSKIKFSTKPFRLNQVLLKIQNFTKNLNSKTICYILSDFQKIDVNTSALNFQKNINYNLVELRNEKRENQFIDSVYISNKNASNWILNIIVKKTTNKVKNLSLSLFNDNLLIAKSVVQKFNNKTAIVKFSIKKFIKFNGRLSIKNPYLAFDNNFYFTINPIKKIRILTIGKYSNTINKLF